MSAYQPIPDGEVAMLELDQLTVDSETSLPGDDRDHSNVSEPLIASAYENITTDVESDNADILIRSPSALPLDSDNENLIDQQSSPTNGPSNEAGPGLYGSVKHFEPWFPAVNPENPRAKTWRIRRSRREVVIWGCFIAISIVCITNFSLAIWAWLHYKKTQDGIRELYHGKCTTVKRINAVAHIVINILSTLLFAISNLILQILAAPTRKEVNQAHEKGNWLDIGAPSFRNLWGIARSRAILWWILAVSSIPIHFLYNSAVFSSLSANDVAIMIAKENFFTGSDWNKDKIGNLTVTRGSNGYKQTRKSGSFSAIDSMYKDYHRDPSQYQNHSIHEMLNTYHNPFDWRPSALIMISTESRSDVNSSMLLAWTIQRQFANSEAHFLCNDQRSSQACSFVGKEASPPQMGEYWWRDKKIDYSVYRATDASQPKVTTCYLQGSPQILLVVAMFNLVKCVCILKVALSDREATLCILGDAIASFLETPDDTTRNLGITTRKHIAESTGGWCFANRATLVWEPGPTAWRHALSARRWAFVILTSVAVVIAGWANIISGLITQRVYHRSISLKSLWVMGFGATNVDEIISWKQASNGQLGLFVNILIANIWQVLLSLAYLAFNSLLSCMLVADEWSRFSNHKKFLRVSYPCGMQRSSYTLSMPLRYSLPMMALSAGGHWLLSQSTFIIRVNRFDWKGDPIRGYTTSGYSFIPCLMCEAVNLFLLHLFAQIAHGMIRKYPDETPMPLASTCSAAISAACHRPEPDKEAHLLPVQWGVVYLDDQDRGYCSFTTARTVTAPLAGSSCVGISLPPSTETPSLTIDTIVDRLREATGSFRRIHRRRHNRCREDV